jgi:hypothetical protein
MKIKDIVKDWGGFEELITDLHQDGELDVQRNVTLIGASGAPRQIDVLIKHKQGPYEYLTLVECKYWKKKVERANIDVLYAGMQDLNAAKGVFFTTKGYQSGAEQYAKSKGITIFVIRELTDDEWGLPGKVIDLYLQVVQKTIAGIKPFDTKVSLAKHCLDRTKPRLSLEFGKNNNKTLNIIISKHKDKYKTLESIMEHAATESVKQFQKKSLLINGGEECTRYLKISVNIPFEEELQIYRDDKIFYLPRVEMTVGLKVSQSKIVIDRSSNYHYALAVIDCVNNQTFTASKHNKSKFSEWSELKPRNKNSTQEYVKNGSIISVSVAGFFDPKELDGLKSVPMQPTKKINNRNHDLTDNKN